MKLLIDVCAGGRLVPWLIRLGHDVATVRDKNPSMSDHSIIEWAVREKRTVVTVDKDFGEIIFQGEELRCGVVRLPDVVFEKRRELLGTILKYYQSELENNSIIIVSKHRIRIKKIFKKH